MQQSTSSSRRTAGRSGAQQSFVRSVLGWVIVGVHFVHHDQHLHAPSKPSFGGAASLRLQVDAGTLGKP